MKIDVWFSKNVHLYGQHGDYVVERWAMPTVGGRGRPSKSGKKKTIRIADKVFPATLPQALKMCVGFDNSVAKDVKSLLKVLKKQNEILEKFKVK